MPNGKKLEWNSRFCLSERRDESPLSVYAERKETRMKFKILPE